MTHRLTRYTLGLGLPALLLAAATACNQPPTAPTLSITPEAPTTVDDLVAETVSEATDPNDDTLITTYQWSMIGAGAPDDAEASIVEGLTGHTVPAGKTEKGQQWWVSVTVSDGEEVVSSESPFGPAMVANSLPVVTSVRISPTSGVDTFGTLTATASGTDIDGDKVEIDLTWYVNGTALDVEGNVLSGDHFAKNDQVHVEAMPNDGEADGEAVGSAVVTILNTAPKIDSVVITPNEIREASELRCEAVGWYDADEDTPTVSTTWMVNGAEVSTDEVLTGALFGKDDLIRCIGTATDGDSEGNTVVSKVIGVLNTPPTLGSVSISNTGPQAADTLTFTANDAVDVDDDGLTFKAEWFVDDVMVGEGDELPPRSFIKTQSIHVVVTPFDGLEYGEPVSSDVATAVNTPPSLTAVTLLPVNMYTDSVAFPSVAAEDLDGDPITYARSWEVNGSAVSATTAILDGADWFDKTDTVSVTITPNDGEDDGVALTSAVTTVLNSAPTIPAISIDPEKPKSDDDLWVVVDEASTDADEDDLEYTFTWTLDGTEFTDTGTIEYAGDYVSTDYTNDGDSWNVLLEVTDGTETVTAELDFDVLDWAGQRDFNNCGKTGYTGPSSSQCTSAYAGTPVADDTVTVSSGIQTWTVPQDGTYRITAKGARGGKGSYGSTGDAYHANGARVRGDFTLTAGDTIRILVGQEGRNYGYGYSAGGGGGTYVVNSDGTILAIAAGGGGNGYGYYRPTGCYGNASAIKGYGTTSYSGACSRYSYTGTGGGSYYSSYGGGGAGYNSDGGYFSTSYRAKSFTGGGQGGRYYVEGGFGGGGGAYYFYGGGGGGGYGGGNGGYRRGGGATSKNNGSSQVNTDNANASHGAVTIDLAP